MFRGKKMLILDMDGTLIDSVGVWNAVDLELIRRLGGESSEADIQADRDRVLRERSAAPQPYMDYCAFLKDKYGSDLTPEQIHDRRYEISRVFTAQKVDFKPGAPDFLRGAKARGFRLAIATTTRRRALETYSTINQKMTEQARLTEICDPILTREDVSAMKPDPEVYLKALALAGLRAADCLAFEDSLVGLESAIGAGLATWAIRDRYSENDRAAIDAAAGHPTTDWAEALAALKAEIPG